MSSLDIKRQQGFVSIIVAISFMIIMSLVTTSFALLSRREARQALDRQLSTQAFYAAESGVNDAVHKMFTAGLSDINNCGDVTEVGNPDLGNGLSYTCVLIDEEPTSLDYSSVGTEKSMIVKVQTADGSPIQTLQIGWQAENGNQVFTNFSNHQLPDVNTNKQGLDQTGILRLTLIPGNPPYNRTSLTNAVGQYWLYPKASASAGNAGQVGYNNGLAAQGAFVDGLCNAGSVPTLPRYCNAEITGLNSLNTSTLYLRMKSVYAGSQVTIRALTSGSGQAAFVNSQAQIDATGRANDVLRRIQVRVPLENSYHYPEFALESGDDICKRMNIPASGIVNDVCSQF